METAVASKQPLTKASLQQILVDLDYVGMNSLHYKLKK
jgi:hypothetical protein